MAVGNRSPPSLTFCFVLFRLFLGLYLCILSAPWDRLPKRMMRFTPIRNRQKSYRINQMIATCISKQPERKKKHAMTYRSPRVEKKSIHKHFLICFLFTFSRGENTEAKIKIRKQTKITTMKTRETFSYKQKKNNNINDSFQIITNETICEYNFFLHSK